MKNYLKKLKESQYLSSFVFMNIIIVIGLCSNKSIKTNADFLLISLILSVILWIVYLMINIKIEK